MNTFSVVNRDICRVFFEYIFENSYDISSIIRYWEGVHGIENGESDDFTVVTPK
jgi:hypothetical protein